MKTNFIVLLICFSFFSCGSGTFEDDPESWNKLFGEDVPNEVEVLNSRFWKSTHWTYEYELFIKFKSNSDFVDAYFIEKYNLKKQNMSGTLYFAEKPDWFNINDYDNYMIWKGSVNDLTLFASKTDNIFYLHSLQL